MKLDKLRGGNCLATSMSHWVNARDKAYCGNGPTVRASSRAGSRSSDRRFDKDRCSHQDMVRTQTGGMRRPGRDIGLDRIRWPQRRAASKRVKIRPRLTQRWLREVMLF